MSDQHPADVPDTSIDSDPPFEADAPPVDAAAMEETSAEFVGRWNRLVSTTNWEKGRIISQWRQSLMEAGAPSHEYSDEAWSRRVGNVSGQHVGRLRRVHEQFGQVCQDYQGLYWSHFQAALDWHDAEMWLEGAVQSGWSVAQMRAQRWEATGARPAEEPRPEDIVNAELDEDVDAAIDQVVDEAVDQFMDSVRNLQVEEAPTQQTEDAGPPAESQLSPDESQPVELVRPFESLPPLPDDLAEAFESFKIAIIAHKSADWRDISRNDLLATLDALKQLAMAPSSEG